MLSELVHGLSEIASSPAALPARQIAVTGVTMDSRQVRPGNVFVAISGGASDGHRYLPDAIRRGACAIIGTQPLTGLEVPYIQVGDSREALAQAGGGFLRLSRPPVGDDRCDRHRWQDDHIEPALSYPAGSRPAGGDDQHGQCGDRRPGLRYRLPRHHPRSAQRAGLSGANGAAQA